MKRTINWNKSQSKAWEERKNQYLDNLTDPSFQEVNNLFILSFENDVQRASYNRSFLTIFSTEKIKNQPVKNNLRGFNNI